MSPKLIAVKFNAEADIMNKLKAIAVVKDQKVSDVIRDALRLQVFLSKHLQVGDKLLVERADGSMSQIVFSDA